MSIVTFWNSSKEQVGKTLAIAAIATQYTIQHNKKVLVVSTSYNDDTLKNCYWVKDKSKKGMGIFGKNSNIGIENGIEGLVKILRSNKIMPNIITDYTKIVFRDRLEVLLGYEGIRQGYEEIQNDYAELVELAGRYYDLVLVDLDDQVNSANKKEILRKSNVIVATISQRLRSIDNFTEELEDSEMIEKNKTIPLVCRYDRRSKYTAKNIARYMGQKRELITIPYNTLFFEATEEGKIVDLFLRLRNIDEADKNAYFMREVKRATDEITYKIQELQMR